MITAETRAEICRLVRVEHCTVTRAAKLLGIHHQTVKYALANEGRVHSVVRARRSGLDPYADFIRHKIDQYPDIKASMLWRLVKDRGYQGSEQTVRDRVAFIRGSMQKRAYLPLSVFPGDQAQVDWAHFGSIAVGKTTRKLSCFVMVLAHSRALFAKFFFDQTLDSFLAGHVEAFSYFGGVPREIRYDNLKAAVAERHGQTIRYNSQLLEMAGYYAFKPSACNPYSGHEKGKVERNVRYIRDSFFYGTQFPTIEKLNAALSSWLMDVTAKRKWPDDERLNVQQAWEAEKSKLIPLPAVSFAIRMERPVRSGKIPFIRFDKNDYSIPYQLTGQPLSLSADLVEVRISHGSQVIASHPRSYSGGEKIVIQEHFSGITANKAGAETVAARCYLNKLIPESSELLSLITERGGGVGSATAKLFELMRSYGSPILKEAICQAVERSYGEVGYVAMVCDQIARKRKDVRPSLPVDLKPGTPGIDLHVTPHDSATYDELAKD